MARESAKPKETLVKFFSLTTGELVGEDYRTPVRIGESVELIDGLTYQVVRIMTRIDDEQYVDVKG